MMRLFSQPRPLIANVFVFLTAISTIVWQSSCQAAATVTERLIATEIIRLGGDVEILECPELVGFYGPKFESRHFEFLRHLPTVRIVAIIGATADRETLSYFDSCPCLDEVQIERPTSFNGEGLANLGRQRYLTQLWVESAVFSSDGIDELTMMKSLRELELHDVGLPEGTLPKLRRLSGLTRLVISSRHELPDSEITMLRNALPECEIFISIFSTIETD